MDDSERFEADDLDVAVLATVVEQRASALEEAASELKRASSDLSRSREDVDETDGEHSERGEAAGRRRAEAGFAMALEEVDSRYSELANDIAAANETTAERFLSLYSVEFADSDFADSPDSSDSADEFDVDFEVGEFGGGPEDD